MPNFTPPKLNSYYENIAIKNFYQPFYDLINAQSIWTDFISRWFTDYNKKIVQNIDEMVNKS